MNKINIKLIIGITISLIFIGIFVRIFIYDNKNKYRLEAEYPLLKRSDSINGIIQFKFDFRSIKARNPISSSLLKVNNNKNEIIADEIKANNSLGINEILSVGDSIFKEKDNDTIVVKQKSTGKLYILLRRNELY